MSTYYFNNKWLTTLHCVLLNNLMPPHIPLYGSYRGTFRNEPLLNDFLYQEIVKYMKKDPRYNEVSSQRTHSASPLALRYIEVPVYLKITIPIQMHVYPCKLKSDFPTVVATMKKKTTKTKRLLKVKTDRKSPPFTLVPLASPSLGDRQQQSLQSSFLYRSTHTGANETSQNNKHINIFFNIFIK